MRIIEGRCTHCDGTMTMAKWINGKWAWVPSETMFPGCPGNAKIIMVEEERNGK